MTIFNFTDIFGWAELHNPLGFFIEIEFNHILDLLCTWFYKVYKSCFFDSKCFRFWIRKVEEHRIFAIICAVGRVIVTNFINHWLIVLWWLWGTSSRGSKLKIIFLIMTQKWGLSLFSWTLPGFPIFHDYNKKVMSFNKSTVINKNNWSKYFCELCKISRYAIGWNMVFLHGLQRCFP